MFFGVNIKLTWKKAHEIVKQSSSICSYDDCYKGIVSVRVGQKIDTQHSLRGHNGWNYDIPPDLIIPIELFRSHIRSIDTISMNTQAEENKILGTL